MEQIRSIYLPLVMLEAGFLGKCFMQGNTGMQTWDRSVKFETLFDITILMICLLLAQVEMVAAFRDGIVNAASHFAHSIGAMEVSS